MISEEFHTMLSSYLGLAGAGVAATVGILTRHVYSEGGFEWRRAALDVPFAAFSAIIAGGVGTYLNLPEQVIYAIAGAIGYMSPQFLSQMIRRVADKKIGGTDDEGHDINAEGH